MPHLFESRLKELKIQLPKPLKPVGAYKPVVVAGAFAFLSGQISKDSDGKLWQGKVGRDLSLEEGIQAARAAGLNVVSLLQSEIGLARVRRIVRTVGYVQCLPDFTDIHKVMNGASDLFFEVFGDAGIHARSAVGMVSLPLNASVEVEVTVEVTS